MRVPLIKEATYPITVVSLPLMIAIVRNGSERFRFFWLSRVAIPHKATAKPDRTPGGQEDVAKDKKHGPQTNLRETPNEAGTALPMRIYSNCGNLYLQTTGILLEVKSPFLSPLWSTLEHPPFVAPTCSCQERTLFLSGRQLRLMTKLRTSGRND
jgi:hypothetical protein